MNDNENRDVTGEADVIDIAIADKSPLVQGGLRALFEADDRFRIVAVASDGERFMAAVDRLTFDIGVIGWEMPYMGGAAVLRALRECDRAPRMVVYTGSQDLDVPRQAMALGAADDYWYMWKLPMFGEKDVARVLAEVEACHQAWPGHLVRLIGYDNYAQSQGSCVVVHRPAG